jgi:hypothetical protein
MKNSSEAGSVGQAGPCLGHDDAAGLGDADGSALFVHQLSRAANVVFGAPTAVMNASSLGNVQAYPGWLTTLPEPTNPHSSTWPERTGKYPGSLAPVSSQGVIPCELLPVGGQPDVGGGLVGKPTAVLKFAKAIW